MDSARYFVALLVLVSLPPALLLWLAIHPFARFWRKLGPVRTYAILALPCAALITGVIAARRSLLATDFGTSYPLNGLSLLCLFGAGTIALRRKRYLTYGILAGLPELSSERYPGRLLTEGIYGSIRHPRYVETLLWTLGYVLFANYLVTYAAFAIAVPVMYLVVVLEERELRQRFGREYEDYSRRVPRFLPGWRGRKS